MKLTSEEAAFLVVTLRESILNTKKIMKTDKSSVWAKQLEMEEGLLNKIERNVSL
jgi:hypothetical protein